MIVPPRIRAASAVLLFAALAVAFPATALAAGENTPLDLPAQSPSHSTGGGSWVRTIVGLAIVVGVIYGLTWVLRQARASRDGRSSAGTALASEGMVALAPGRSVHLVRAGREIHLVGVAEHSVTPLRVYTEEEAEALGLFESRPEAGPEQDGPASASTFMQRLTDVWRAWLDALRERTVRR